MPLARVKTNQKTQCLVTLKNGLTPITLPLLITLAIAATTTNPTTSHPASGPASLAGNRNTT
jgi:hypothetical protein